MGKKYWIVYLLVAAAAATGTWLYAPAARTFLPEGLQARCRAAARRVYGLFGDAAPESQGGTKTITVVKQAPKTAKAKPAAAPAAKPAAGDTEEELPSLLGVVQTAPAAGVWGVTAVNAPVRDLSGKALGSVPGGRTFKVLSAEREGRSFTIHADFGSDKLPHDVTLDGSAAYCFTGSPDVLSARQREGLKKYYEYAAKAQVRREEIERENAKKSPFAAQVLAAHEAHAAKAAAVKKLIAQHGETDMRVGAMKGEMIELANAVKEANEKHKAWKKEHASELDDPAKDPAYRKLLAERNAFAEAIPGLAF